jgi:hydroxyethylthiazole kinase-like uncharacterized protein yjeF
LPVSEPLHPRVIVTAREMQALEARLFAAGMPVAALMEKVAERIAQWLEAHYPRDGRWRPVPRDHRFPTVGILVGPGHNGGDALVVARELHHQGYGVQIYCLSDRHKDLTATHLAYARHLGIPIVETITDLEACAYLVDGGFGLGLTRPLTGAIAAAVETVNGWGCPVVSIDLPSGLHTDTGQPLGAAIRATHTLCLGLWKRGLLQDAALPFCGEAVLLPFDIPDPDIEAVVGREPPLQRLTPAMALAQLPLDRAPTAHKYTVGHLLLVAGSERYGGAALLAGRGAIASGVGMVTLVVPERLRLTALAQLPEALVLGAAESSRGAIQTLPDGLDLNRYDAIACGPGMTVDSGAFEAIWRSDRPVVLDADGLNWLAQQSPELRQSRPAPTLVTPHAGEFRRLFPDIDLSPDAIAAATAAAQATGWTVVLKGARTAIAPPHGTTWVNPDSTPALARGGSGDVLTGLMGGLAVQRIRGGAGADEGLLAAALGGVWWHAQTARAIAQQHTVLGSSPSQLAAMLLETLGAIPVPKP